MNRFVGSLLRSPLLLGGAASAAFFWLLHAGLLGKEFFPRYVAGHPVEYVETILFFIGFAVLVIRTVEVARQRGRLGAILLGPIPRGGQTAADCQPLLDRLDAVPDSAQNDYLVRRLHDGLSHVHRQASSESLDDHLKYLSDMDAERSQSNYGLLRLIVWAIPILGFLGTVIGITMAIASIRIDALAESMVEVTTGLGVAFDTTALALALVTVLMFFQHYVERAENALLSDVDRRAEEELLGRFPRIPNTPEGQLVAMRKMSDAMVASLEQIVKRQAELWQASMNSAQQRWTQTAEETGKQLHSVLAGALTESSRAHAQQIVAAEEAAADKNRRHWGDVQKALTTVADRLGATQQALVQKSEVLNRAIGGTEQVARLEETLNRNLAALAGSKNFEETVMSLAATIHLLNSRLSGSPAAAPSVQLDGHRRTGQAA